MCFEKSSSKVELLVFPVLESRNTVLRKDCVIWGRWLRICDLFETLLLLERTGKTSNEHWEKL